jgi:hypothetical protein
MGGAGARFYELIRIYRFILNEGSIRTHVGKFVWRAFACLPP